MDEVREALSRLCGRVGLVEEAAGCRLYYCDGGEALLVAVYEDEKSVYAKMVAEAAVKPHMWHCSDLLYTPYGLYAFARDPRGLAERLAAKKPRALAQARLMLERAAEADEG